ncbi:MAG TPA: hypothetical protein P5534_21840 [Candidatus Paceibacterota bacterium]|nr:hypothetical protein [Candidatus Paceibacterota bacterium]
MKLTEREIAKLAQAIASGLFTNGHGETADRLVLELPNKRDGGGWGIKLAEDHIAKIIRAIATGKMQ